MPSEDPETLLISFNRARAMTGLDLVAARDMSFSGDISYHDAEDASESPSHKSAREEAVKFFTSRGYSVFPEGVGVRGTFALADMLAVREPRNRIVFVEVLTDFGVRPETIERKLQLQKHGEICFVLLHGKKAYQKTSVEELKRSIRPHADVLTCFLDGYHGNFIETGRFATVSYDTTRDQGICVEATAREARTKATVEFRFLTRLYPNPNGVLISDTVPPESVFLEEQFQSAFEDLCKKHGARIKFTRTNRHVTAIRAMRRKSGLKAVLPDGAHFGSVRSDYRGPAIDEPYQWTHHPSARDVPGEHLFGVYELSLSVPNIVQSLIDLYAGYGLKVQVRP